MKITTEQLVKSGLAGPNTAAKVVEALSDACSKFGVNTGLRVAGFLAQCAHESTHFTRTEENLNYSRRGLLQTWPKRFTPELASDCAYKPERIANIAYANRMGNGDEASGDGWRYRGRGFIQLTGHDNYQAFGDAIGEDVVSHPELVAQPRLAALSAAWYWQTHGLNALADAQDIVGMTKRINGGTVGLEERKKLYQQALKVF